MDKMFETATREQYRFPYKGQISVEDLWQLPATELDKVFKAINTQLREEEAETLLSTKNPAITVLENKIEIIRYIVGVKLAEAEAAKQASSAKAKMQKIMAILADKQDEELRGKSADELRAMLQEMDK